MPSQHQAHVVTDSALLQLNIRNKAPSQSPNCGTMPFYSLGFLGQRKTTAMTSARKQTVPSAASCTVSGRPGKAPSTLAKPANGSRSDIIEAPSLKEGGQLQSKRLSSWQSPPLIIEAKRRHSTTPSLYGVGQRIPILLREKSLYYHILL